MTMPQELSNNVFTELISDKDVLFNYPTMLGFCKKKYADGYDRRGPKTIVHELYVIYRRGVLIMVDKYYKESGRRSDKCYGLYKSETFAELMERLDETDPLYDALVSARRNYIHWRSRSKVKAWLGKARERIVATEAHPDRVRELLESGVDLDDIGDIIDSRTASKLSW